MSKFNVEKSIFAKVPVERAFSVVRDFSQWKIWSPWIIAEPDCKQEMTVDGKKQSWDGKIVGTGEMIIDSEEQYKRID